MLENFKFNMKEFPTKADRLDLCNALGLAVLLLAALAVLGVCGDAVFRSNTAGNQSAPLVRTFGLDRLSLVPSGRWLRSPDTPNGAVEWRYDPHLAGIPQDAADLLMQQ